jgi:hypothetical protein
LVLLFVANQKAGDRCRVVQEHSNATYLLVLTLRATRSGYRTFRHFFSSPFAVFHSLSCFAYFSHTSYFIYSAMMYARLLLLVLLAASVLGETDLMQRQLQMEEETEAPETEAPGADTESRVPETEAPSEGPGGGPTDEPTASSAFALKASAMVLVPAVCHFFI